MASSSERASATPSGRLIALFSPERADIALIVLFSAITGLLYLATPLTVDSVVQNIAFGGQQQIYIQALVILALTLLVFLLLLSVVSIVQHYIAELIQRRLFTRISADLSFRLPRLNNESLRSFKKLELVNRFLDVGTVQKTSAMVLLDGVNVILAALIGMLALAFYHPFLLAFDLILLASLIAIIIPFNRAGIRTSIKESYAKHALAGWFEQLTLTPVRFKRPDDRSFSERKTNGFVKDYLDARRRHYRILITQIIGLLALQAVASAALLGIGGFLVLSGELTLGQLVASELIVSAIVASFVSLGKHIELWYDAVAAMDKLGSIVDLPIERQTGKNAKNINGSMTVEFGDLSFVDKNSRFALNHVTQSVQQGERVGITGPDDADLGALLELIYGLRSSYEGAIKLSNLDLRYWELDSLRLQVQFIQEPDIFEGSVRQNVIGAREDIDTEAIYERFRKFHLTLPQSVFDNGLDTRLETDDAKLTMAQRVKLAFARISLSEPTLILIDQTLDGCDSSEFKPVLDYLFAGEAPATILIASRDTRILDRCDRVLTIQGDGRVVDVAATQLKM